MIQDAVAGPRPTIADLLRLGRLRKGWNQNDLAVHAGVSRTTVFHLERGSSHDPRPTTLHKLARALDLAPDHFATAADPRAFDLATNPAVMRLQERRPDLARRLSPADWQDLAGTIGVGGALTDDGVATVAERLLADREALSQLRVLLQTHLREATQQVIASLYHTVAIAPPGAPSEPSRTATESAYFVRGSAEPVRDSGES
jgi:transcriptional regulator with XRE-family HTH domain